MSRASEDFDEKARIGLLVLAGSDALAFEVEREVTAFFARNPGSIRTPLAEAFIAGLIIDRLSPDPDSQSASQPKAETPKVA
jgi:hypothetical protein